MEGFTPAGFGLALGPSTPPPSKRQKKIDSEKEEVKRRSSKACDQCRRAKCKCSLKRDADGNYNGPCENCEATNQECTFQTNSKKRGPPKGYIEAVESRLHRMEALLGGLLQNEDPRAQALLHELIGDQESRQIFEQDIKAAAAIGRNGKARRSWAPPTAVEGSSKSQSPDITGLGNPSNGSPWISTSDTPGSFDGSGDIDVALLTAPASQLPRNKKRSPSDASGAHPVNVFSAQNKASSTSGAGTIAHTGFATSRDNAPLTSGTPLTELADVVGQLSLNENAEIRYHGRSSGLYLISNSTRYQNFFWQFPKGGIWPSAMPTNDTTTELDRIAAADAIAALPDLNTQAKLLDCYWAYVHPHFPILYRPWFLAQHARTNLHNLQVLGSGPNQIPVFLLLTIFALAARYCEDGQPPKQEGTHWPAGDIYLQKAKALIASEDFGSSRLTSVQGLLLLAYREVGTGAMAHSWSLVGMAIRMAQDMGLFRDVERWCMPVAKFSHEEKQSRKRAWWGCVNMDKYVSAYIGRPMAIFERDWDTALPSEDEPDEHDQWRPVKLDGNFFEVTSQPAKTHAISAFNRASDLSVHMSRIIAHIYAIRVRVLGQSSEALLSHLDQGLAKFYLQLPPHLQYTSASKKAPPPNVLVLHCQFFCALILLHRPFIPSRHDSKDSATSMPSHSIATTAANAIANIATVYSKTYGLQQAVPFMTYYIFSAAIMHVYNTTWPGEAKTAKMNLAKCMKALKEMEGTWGSAARQRELLVGLVDMAEEMEGNAETNPNLSHPRGVKRPSGSAESASPGANASASDISKRPLAGHRQMPASNPFSNPYGQPPMDQNGMFSTSMGPSQDLPPADSQFGFGAPKQDPNMHDSMFSDLLASLLGPTAGTSGTGFSFDAVNLPLHSNPPQPSNSNDEWHQLTAKHTFSAPFHPVPDMGQGSSSTRDVSMFPDHNGNGNGIAVLSDVALSQATTPTGLQLTLNEPHDEGKGRQTSDFISSIVLSPGSSLDSTGAEVP